MTGAGQWLLPGPVQTSRLGFHPPLTHTVPDTSESKVFALVYEVPDRPLSPGSGEPQLAG